MRVGGAQSAKPPETKTAHSLRQLRGFVPRPPRRVLVFCSVAHGGRNTKRHSRGVSGWRAWSGAERHGPARTVDS